MKQGEVKIRNNKTGEVIVFLDKYSSDNYYQWTEGNYGCDCNRELFFHRVKNEKVEEMCSIGRFSVMLPGDDEWI